jgi:hypothetical protein
VLATRLQRLIVTDFKFYKVKADLIFDKVIKEREQCERKYTLTGVGIKLFLPIMGGGRFRSDISEYK